MRDDDTLFDGSNDPFLSDDDKGEVPTEMDGHAKAYGPEEELEEEVQENGEEEDEEEYF